jgi:hypothetical protein
MTRASSVFPGVTESKAFNSIDNSSTISGIAGGVVQSKYFQIKFGVRPAEGPVKQSRIDAVSANVVSALQGGAFFGSLSSAPVSGGSRIPSSAVQLYFGLLSQCKRSFNALHCLQVLASSSRTMTLLFGHEIRTELISP